jgi:hypothetical protein
MEVLKMKVIIHELLTEVSKLRAELKFTFLVCLEIPLLYVYG